MKKSSCDHQPLWKVEEKDDNIEECVGVVSLSAPHVKEPVSKASIGTII